eukprot:jgi/Mesvir1/6914/Mv26512-RA.1
MLCLTLPTMWTPASALPGPSSVRSTPTGARRAWASTASACSSRSSFSRCSRIYGAEAWTLPPKLAARLDGTVYRMLRQVLNVGFSERPSSESLYHGMPRISDEIRQRRIAFVGHLARTSQVDTALGLAGPQRLGQPGRHILTWPGPEGIPKRVGKPVTTYIQMLLDDLVVPAQFEHRIHSLSRLWTAMQDKTRWKRIVKAPDPVGKPPPPKRRRRFDE